MLKFIRSCMTQGLRKRLVESLIVSHIDYCSIAYLDAFTSFRAPLQRLSNACFRYIFGVRMNTHITPYRRQLELQQNNTRRGYFALRLMYRLVRIRELPILLPSPLRLIKLTDRLAGLERTSTFPNYRLTLSRSDMLNCRTLSRKPRVTYPLTRALRMRYDGIC